jgi:flagellar hook-length control protein FliK
MPVVPQVAPDAPQAAPVAPQAEPVVSDVPQTMPAVPQAAPDAPQVVRVVSDVPQAAPVVSAAPQIEDAAVAGRPPYQVLQQPTPAPTSASTPTSTSTPVVVDKPLPVDDETTDETEEVVVLHAAPVQVAVPEVSGASVQAMSEVAALSAATARTENIVETANQVIEAVVGQIRVTPGFAQGECEVKITLKPTVLDGSEILMSSKDGTLTVCVTPATQEASAAAAAALPRLEAALAEHAPAFHPVSVVLALKKGSRNETV